MSDTKKETKIMDYRGVPVYLSGFPNPRFSAAAGGHHHWGGSFDTLRKKLDAALKFEPFEALILGRKGVEQIHIIGVDMEDEEWVLPEGGTTHGGTRIKFYNEIYPLTMRDQLESYTRACKAWDKVEEENKKARHSMRETLEAGRVKTPDKA